MVKTFDDLFGSEKEEASTKKIESSYKYNKNSDDEGGDEVSF